MRYILLMEKSCTAYDAGNVVFIPVSKPFRASQVVHDCFHQPYGYLLTWESFRMRTHPFAHEKLIIPFWGGGRKTHGLKHTPVVRSRLFQRKITLKPVRFSQDSTITQPRESRESPGAAGAFRTLIFCLDQNMAEAWVIWLVVVL